MIKTEFFDDFIAYYKKASILQNNNQLSPFSSETRIPANDPIMDNITIYDTVNRKFAGFSKALEDIHGVRSRPDLVKYRDFSNELTIVKFHFLHLFHRFTGSGASFQPRLLDDGSLNPKEHGYCNNHVENLAECLLNTEPFLTARAYIVSCKDPMVTSVGNQPPSLKNGAPDKYRLAMQYYFDNYATDFVMQYCSYVLSKFDEGYDLGIKEAVDWCCNWHKSKGFKQWHFVLTAFVMDTAEYYPHLVNPSSHCYYGANCVRAFDLMFKKEKKDPKKKAEFQELCMSEISKSVNGNPYDIEDVCCDYIRYLKEYVPKGYDHLTKEETQNNSILKVNGIYPDDINKRIIEVLG